MLDAEAAFRCAREVPEAAQKLAEVFWPGPVALVLPKAEHIPLEASGGRDTVGLRVPDHPVAQALLRACGVPVAAPSANRSGGPAAAAPDRVLEQLDDRLDLLLDSGPAPLGHPSTIVEVQPDGWRVLREGALPSDLLEWAVAEALPGEKKVVRCSAASAHPSQLPKYMSRLHERRRRREAGA